MAQDAFRLDLKSIEQNFTDLCSRFKDLFAKQEAVVQPLWDLGAEKSKDKIAAEAGGPVGPPLPEDFLNRWAGQLEKEIAAGRPYLPLKYRDAYVEPLLRNLGHVVRSSDDAASAHNIAETFAGAVAQHLPGKPVRQPLRQFLAVVSNLYRSFLASDKRVSADLPLVDAPPLPPLAAFHFESSPKLAYGPAVFTTPMTRLLCGSEVAVVVMPATYHRTPLAWVPLAHEAAGHGVLQADEDLLPDLIDGIRALFGGGPLPPGRPLTPEQEFGLLWSYWAEETASDVYGLLNVGPAFALNLAAFLAARRAVVLELDSQQPGTTPAAFPSVAVESGKDPRVDLGVHPVDLLRLYVAIGVIQNLDWLSADTAAHYVEALTRIADLLRRNAWPEDPSAETDSEEPDDMGPLATVAPIEKKKVVIRGRVEIGRERSVRLDLKLDPDKAAESARRVGAFIATTRLGALRNRTVQDLETWDDADELVAGSIAAELLDAQKPLVRGVETGVDKPFKIADALRRAEPTITDDRISQVVAHLKADEFGKLTPGERTALMLNGLTDEDAEHLKFDRIEFLPLGVASGLDLDRIDRLGDDGQLLAGATLAALSDPSALAFRWINRRLAYALNRSHQHDPIMGFAAVHGMFDDAPPPVTTSQHPRERDHDPLEQAAPIGVAAKSTAAKKVPTAAKKAPATTKGGSGGGKAAGRSKSKKAAKGRSAD